MDYSNRMLPYIDEVNEKLLTPVCNQFLSENDSFHLILFNDHPILEISHQIRQMKDNELEDLLFHFNLLYPISEKSDFSSALQYTHSYISSLDVYRHKKLLIVSDGINTESSDFEREKASINYFLKKLVHQGVEIVFFELPSPKDRNIISLDGKIKFLPEQVEGLSERKLKRLWKKRIITIIDNGCDTVLEYKSFFEKQKDLIFAQLLDDGEIIKNNLGILDVNIKEKQGLRSKDMILTIKIKNNCNQRQIFELTQILVEGENVLSENVFAKIGRGRSKIVKAKISLPEELEFGKQEIEAKLIFSNNFRTSPQTVKFNAILMRGKNIPYTIGKIVQVIFMAILTVAILATVIYFVIIKPSVKPSAK